MAVYRYIITSQIWVDFLLNFLEAPVFSDFIGQGFRTFRSPRVVS